MVTSPLFNLASAPALSLFAHMRPAKIILIWLKVANLTVQSVTLLANLLVYSSQKCLMILS